MVTHTVIVESTDVDRDLAPSRDLEHSCLTGLVSNDERGVLGTVLRNDSCLRAITAIIDGNPETCVTITYGWEHPRCFV